MKGIILAGGSGSRLYPLTKGVNKQLLPIYDKPTIYYPLTTLMLAGITEILMISNPCDIPALKALLGDGTHLGIHISYKIQERPGGLPEAFILGEDFIDHEPVAMILGDNFFHGHGLSDDLNKAFNALKKTEKGAHIFVHHVEDPHRYGIVVLDESENVLDIEEKPLEPKSHLAVTGLYFFDGNVSARAKALKPSARGELEIVDLIKSYIKDSHIDVTQLGRGYAWFDVGTPKSLLEASNYVEVLQSRQGVSIASPEEVALHMNFIDRNTLNRHIDTMPNCKYRDYLKEIV